MGTCVAKIFALLVLFLPYGTLPPIQSEKHSLYYIYTALSKPVDLPGIYQFSAMGLLDDKLIHSYNSEEQKKIPTQHYSGKGSSQSRESKEQWFNVNLDILMKPMRHNDSDLHVLQWRIGCEVEEERDEVKVFKGVYEYSYDGENFLSFDEKESQWVASVDEALPTKRKWDNVVIINQYIKGYLEKECVDWLNKFREYADEELRNTSVPDVRVFARKSSDESKLKLTCLATGFYSKDVMMTIRKYRTSLPEREEVISLGIRPNHDGTFQLRKSVEINEDEKAEYDCFVSHRTFKEPIIVRWDGKSQYWSPGFTAAVILGLLLAAVVLLVYILKRKCGQRRALEISNIDINITTSLKQRNPPGQDTDSGIGEISASSSRVAMNEECEDSSSEDDPLRGGLDL